MKLIITLLCVIITLLFGCEISREKTLPEELLGEWETSAPRYDGCILEFVDKKIIFQNELTYMKINYITHIEKSPQGNRTLYNIYYEDLEEIEAKFSFYYYKVKDKAVIVFKNQKEMEWTKKE